MSAPVDPAPPIPVVLARLKLRMMVNRSRRNNGLGMVLGCIAACLFGTIGLAVSIAAAHASDPSASRAFVVIGANILVVAWAVLPLITFGTDETLDPARLQLLPIPRRPLIAGLLGASLIGYAPAAVLLTLTGVLIGYASGAGAIVTFVAVVLLAVLAAAAARTLSTALASSLTSRKGRDVLIALGAFFGIGIQLVRFVHINTESAALDHASDIARWLPPGCLGQAIVDARAGHLARSVVELVPALLSIVILLAVWARLLERSLTVVTGGSTSARTRARTDHTSRLFPRGARFLPSTPWAAVAAKELRYVAREPRRRIVLVQLCLVGIGGPVWFAITSRSLSPGTVLIASLAGYLVLIGASNQFGFDGGALWLDIVAGNHVRAEIVGKNAALVLQVLPVVFVGSIVLASFSGGWLYIPAALVIAGAGLGAGLSVANLISVRFPQRLPETRNPFGGVASGEGCVTALVLFAGMFVQGILLAPVVIAAAVCSVLWPIGLVVVAPGCALYGYALWRASLNLSEQWAWWRQPELLLAVDPQRGV